MAGEKRSSDLSSRLSVKRSGKLISKTLSKSSPPSISAPPKAAVGASKVQKDEVQRRKNSFHDMFKGSTKEKDGRQAPFLVVSATDATPQPQSQGSRGNVAPRAAIASERSNNSQPLRHEDSSPSESDRLLELEKALALAKEETAALKHELERVKQDAQASVEISRYHAAEEHRQGTPESSIDARAYISQGSDDEMHDREEYLANQNNELRCRISELEDQLITQSTSNTSEVLHKEEDWDALTLRLHEIEKESYSRLQQLLSLKTSISSLTRADSQASDSELADSFAQLANRVREWVVSHYRRTKMSFDDLPDTTVHTLRSIKVNYEETNGADKLALYQAVVSRMLMRIFEEPLVVGMPDQDVFARLRAFYKGTQHVGAESWDWRRATLRVVEKSAEATTICDWKTQTLEKWAFELEAVMRSISSTGLTKTARLALFGIMNFAADLQRTLCLQKAMYCVVFFGTNHEERHHFDDHAMEPVNDIENVLDEGGEPIKQRDFIFCVFPCLQKLDNGMGNIVFRARVCCGVG